MVRASGMILVVVVTGLAVVAGCGKQGPRSAPDKAGESPPATAAEEPDELPKDLTEPPTTEASAGPEESAAPHDDHEKTGDVIWGTCEVSIPYRRQPGTLPEPSILRLEFSQDPAKHVVLMEIELLPDADFWMRLRARVEASQEKKLLLFVHGYSATFRDAARRTAQMAYDINYQGPSMFFSWPAGSESERFEEKANTAICRRF